MDSTAVSSPIGRWVPRGSWVLPVMASALVFVAMALQRNYQTDFWHHLARGRAIVEQGQLVDEDIFSYTVAGSPLRDANWLTQVLYFELFRRGGLMLVQVVNAVTLTAAFALLVGLCARRCGSWRLAGFLGVFAFLTLWQLLIIRPQTFSLLLFVLLLLVLDRAEQHRRWLLLPPLILALWANMHGGFPIGLLPVGGHLLAAAIDAGRSAGWRAVPGDHRVRDLGGCLGLCLLATLVNPYGWRVYEYVWTVSVMAAGRPIMEWAPPGVGLIVGKFFVLSVMLVLATFAWSPRRPSARELVLVLVFLPLASGAIRMVPWWLMVALPVAGAQLAAALPPRWLHDPADDQPSWVAASFLALVGLLGLLAALSLEPRLPIARWLQRDHRLEDDLQVVADQLLSRPRRSGHLFSRFEWGEYLGWALAPAGYRIFMDGRLEIYPSEVWDDYQRIRFGHADWQAKLDHYQVDFLVLDSDDPDLEYGLAPVVRRSPRWRLVAEQGPARLWERVP
ncbi:MAG: hypothetical protein NZ700_06400 [Gemmataceae bacterium]|nr:hypothetical protein [Gemmataceae bacterium]MDW8266154.1 hypothetical protein [Gemmataceae bacterium]